MYTIHVHYKIYGMYTVTVIIWLLKNLKNVSVRQHRKFHNRD